MNFQQLEYALAVHQLQHFAKAAEQCFVTQATLSAMIIKLEEELGYSLFDRSKKPILTTEQGQQFMNLARNILDLKKEALQIPKNPNELLGPLTIGIIPTVASSLLPLILPRLLEKNIHLQLKIIELTTDQIKKKLLSSEIDLGVLATPLRDDHFDELPLYYEPMMVYGIKQSSKNYVSSADVRNQNIWLLEEGHCFRNQTLIICEIQEKKIKSPLIDFEASSFETLIQLTEHFGGLTLIPELYYQQLSEDRKIYTKGFRKPYPVREISIVSYRSAAHQQAISYLSKLIQSIVPPRLSTLNVKLKDLEIIGV